MLHERAINVQAVQYIEKVSVSGDLEDMGDGASA